MREVADRRVHGTTGELPIQRFCRDEMTALQAIGVQEVQVLLTTRKQLQAKLQDIESRIRGIVRGFGLKVGLTSKASFEARVREPVIGQAILERVAGAMLSPRTALSEANNVMLTRGGALLCA